MKIRRCGGIGKAARWAVAVAGFSLLVATSHADRMHVRKYNGTLVAGGDVVEVQLTGMPSYNQYYVVYRADQATDNVFELYGVSLDGGTPVKLNGALVAGGNVVRFLAGQATQRVLYLADQATDEMYELYYVGAGGGAVTKLSGTLVAGGDVTDFLFSANNDHVVFLADRETDEVFELYRVAYNGGAITKLNSTLVAGGDVTSFQIYANATVVYIADQDTDDVFELYSVPITGGAVTKLNGALTAGGNVTQFKIAPDGSRVVYLADQSTDGVFELYSVPLTGGTVTKISGAMTSGGNVTQFFISPNSTRVVYLADQDSDEVFELYSVPIAGGAITKLSGALTAGGDVTQYLISANSARVIFLADKDSDEVFELYSVPIGGGAVTKLNPAFSGSQDVTQFNISADSASVVYVANATSPEVYELYRVPIAGGTLTKLNGTLVSGGNVTSFQIAADSGRVVYMADQATDEVFELFTVPITGGTAMRINSALVAGGDVKFFMLTGNSYRALYIADQAADEVDEVYGGLVYPLLDIYVRGDGSGSDTTKGGTSWSDAYATLNKAFQSLTYLKELSPTTTPGPHRIYVQASTGAQKYDVAAARTTPYTSVPAYAMHVEFLGGWNNVDTTPVQNGWSVVHDADGTIDETPINWRNTAHYGWEWFDFTRFVFTNVLRGINLESDAGCDGGSVWCYMSNIFISARQEGIRLEHLHGYPVGGLTRLIATNITVTAGLGGPYHAVRIRGDFRGTRIGATTPANVSAITSAGGAGVYLWANYNTTYDAAIYDTVIYGCASNAVYMGAGASGTWYPVRGTFDNVTIADNGWAGGYDGIRMLSRTAGSWARVYDSIFADNAGHGVNVGESGYNVFVCYEGTNVFYNDTIMDEGTLQSFDPSTKTTDPMFAAEKTKPDPWYKLASPFSPAYKSDSRGRNRGAYQINAIKKGTTFMIR